MISGISLQPIYLCFPLHWSDVSYLTHSLSETNQAHTFYFCDKRIFSKAVDYSYFSNTNYFNPYTFLGILCYICICVPHRLPIIIPLSPNLVCVVDLHNCTSMCLSHKLLVHVSHKLLLLLKH